MKSINIEVYGEMPCLTKILDNFLIAHDMPLDEGWNLMCNDFYNIASANHVDNATLFVAYMDWVSKSKISDKE